MSSLTTHTTLPGAGLCKNGPSRFVNGFIFPEEEKNEISVSSPVRDRLGNAANPYFTDCGNFLLSSHKPSNADLAIQ